MGKGSNPRTDFTDPNWREGYDAVFGKKGKIVCPHGKIIGDDCAECLKLAKPGYVGNNWRNKKTTE